MSTLVLIGLAATRPGSGKTTVAEALVQQAGFVRMPLAAPLKRIGMTVLLEYGIPELDARRYLYSERSARIPGMPTSVTGRHLLQTLGTEWGRRCISQTLWLDCWRSSFNKALASAVAKNRELRVVVDDVRYPNEANMIRRLGGVMWMLDRPRSREEAMGDLRRRFSPRRLLSSPSLLLPWKLFGALHPSEGGLNGYRGFRCRIHNDGTIHDLLGQVWKYSAELGVRPGRLEFSANCAFQWSNPFDPSNEPA